MKEMENERPLISVIVPVYNAAETLPESLGNLLHQTYPNLEVLLVDDVSTDGSREILQAAKAQFPERVRLLFQEENKGPGAARNRGIREAKGELIGFMDADDRVDTALYERLYGLLQRFDADVSDCAFLEEEKKEAYLHIPADYSGALDEKKRNDLISYGGYVWSKLYKKTLLTENGITFREVYALEDLDFMMQVLYFAKRVAGTEEILYRHRDRGGSLSKEEAPEKKILLCADTMAAIRARFAALPESEAVRPAVECCIATLYSNAVNLCLLHQETSPALFSQLLAAVRALGESCITGALSDNPYIREKLPPTDLKVLEEVRKSV